MPAGLPAVLVAQVTPSAGPNPLFLILIVMAIWYFVLIRPQIQEQNDHKEMLAGLVKGDSLVTRGGLIVKVVEVRDNELLVDLGNAKARLEKDSVARKILPDASKA